MGTYLRSIFFVALGLQIMECFIVFLESPNVVVDLDGLKVRPNHTRCTVILREIPDDTQIHEVEVSYFLQNDLS